MISTSCHIVSRLAITGVLSVCFFNQCVVRPIRSGPRTGSTGRVVVSVCTTTVILVIAAHRTASKILSGEIGAPSTGKNLTDTVPTAPDGQACKLYQDTRPAANLVPLLAQTHISPFSSSSSSPVPESTPSITITLDLSTFASKCNRLSITSNTTLDLSTLTSNCNRFSITSDTTLIAHDDDSKDVFTDETSDTKDIESSGYERTTHEDNYAIPHTTDDHQVDILPPTFTIHNGSSPPSKLRPLFLVDKFGTTPTNTITNHSRSGSAHITDALLQKTETANSLRSGLSVAADNDFVNLEDVFTDGALDVKDVELSGDKMTPHEDKHATPDNYTTPNNSAHTTTRDKRDHHINVLLPRTTNLAIDSAPSRPPNLRPRTTSSTITNPSLPISTHPTDLRSKAAASWLRPLILVAKHTAGRFVPPPPTALPRQQEKSRPHKLKQQKRKPRTLQLNAACDSIVRSRLRRHADRIFGHLVQVCEQVHVDQAGLINDWIAAMAEVGLTSTLAGNHTTSPRSPLLLTVDAVLVPEPGSRIKARLASLRQRTNAVAASIPATTCESKFSLPWRRTS